MIGVNAQEVPATGTALAVEGLGVQYGRATALDGVSLNLPKGSVYALLGRNGAGKSSLVRCVLGQQKPTSGGVTLFGADAWKSRTAAMTRIGVVPEEPNAPPEMTAVQLARFCSRLYSRWDQTAFEQRLARFEVPTSVPFGRLSKGQKGLVQLSLALAPAPELLILDDPTLGLDAVARTVFFEELVGELADRGTTVFLTTHDLSGVEGIADRVGILKDGKLALDESMETLKSRFRRIRYANEVTEERTEFGKELDPFFALKVKVRGWGVEAVVNNYDDPLFERFQRTEGVVDAEAAAMSLEEIFLAVAGEPKGVRP
ncbi:MAG: ABC transporter ATP-binding protein [Thermoanaerobaculia bacterium]